jgi:signal transduction histidine kinase
METPTQNARLLIILFIVVMVVITVISFLYIYTLSQQGLEDSVHANLKSTAVVIASQVDGDRFATIRPGDEQTQTFTALRDALHRAEKSDPTFRYIYTMRLNGSTAEFVVDADYGIEPDAAAIGEPYLNASPALLQGFSTPSADLQPGTDRWGTQISGYAPIRDSSGRAVGLVGVDEDSRTIAQGMERLRTADYGFILIIIVLFATGAIIFEIRRNRAEALTQLAIRKLNQLNSIIRHDIFNTLTGLSGYVEMAQETTDPNESARMLKTIATLTDKIQEQVAFTRDYQDLGLHEPVWQNVQKTVTKAVSRLNVRPVIAEFDFEDLEILADPLLDRVFLHLLGSSLTTGGGVTRIHGYYRQSAMGVIIVIEDDGAGIPGDQKEEIFRQKGTGDAGHGLFLVQEILGLTGIAISETGTPGHGARFEIHVPKKMARVTRGR